MSLRSTASIWDDGMTEANKDFHCVTHHTFSGFAHNPNLVFFSTDRQLDFSPPLTSVLSNRSIISSPCQLCWYIGRYLTVLQRHWTNFCVCVQVVCGHLMMRQTQASWTVSGPGGEDSEQILDCPTSTFETRWERTVEIYLYHRRWSLLSMTVLKFLLSTGHNQDTCWIYK